MPLTTSLFSSEEELTTKPPGHIQNEYTPLPLLRFVASLYGAGSSFEKASEYMVYDIISCGCSILKPTAKSLASMYTFKSCNFLNVSRAL